jgi:hypothetical protein
MASRFRMMCVDCHRTTVPATVLEGTDVVEMLGWLCFGVPGLVYCWWRHYVRIKVCAHCGSENLIREARAASRRQPPVARSYSGEPIRNRRGAVLWPRALRLPRDRMRIGATALLLLALPFASWGVAQLCAMGPEPSAASVGGASLLGALWLGREILSLGRRATWLGACRAWDASGRPRPIEIL